MAAYTIVTTAATQGSEELEVTTISDDFTNEFEVLGYSRRMADEMLELAEQLLLDFDFCSVAIYGGELVDEELDSAHASFIGLWFLTQVGPAYLTAEDHRADASEGAL